MSYYRLNLLSVLVVDDDPDICALINDLLRALGFGRCLTAVNGEVAMAILADSEATPIDLVITEIAMEPGDGGDPSAVDSPPASKALIASCRWC